MEPFPPYDESLVPEIARREAELVIRPEDAPIKYDDHLVEIFNFNCNALNHLINKEVYLFPARDRLTSADLNTTEIIQLLQRQLQRRRKQIHDERMGLGGPPEFLERASRRRREYEEFGDHLDGIAPPEDGSPPDLPYSEIDDWSVILQATELADHNLVGRHNQVTDGDVQRAVALQMPPRDNALSFFNLLHARYPDLLSRPLREEDIDYENPTKPFVMDILREKYVSKAGAYGAPPGTFSSEDDDIYPTDSVWPRLDNTFEVSALYAYSLNDIFPRQSIHTRLTHELVKTLNTFVNGRPGGKKKDDDNRNSGLGDEKTSTPKDDDNQNSGLGDEKTSTPKDAGTPKNSGADDVAENQSECSNTNNTISQEVVDEATRNNRVRFRETTRVTRAVQNAHFALNNMLAQDAHFSPNHQSAPPDARFSPKNHQSAQGAHFSPNVQETPKTPKARNGRNMGTLNVNTKARKYQDQVKVVVNPIRDESVATRNQKINVEAVLDPYGVNPRPESALSDYEVEENPVMRHKPEDTVFNDQSHSWLFDRMAAASCQVYSLKRKAEDALDKAKATGQAPTQAVINARVRNTVRAHLGIPERETIPESGPVYDETGVYKALAHDSFGEVPKGSAEAMAPYPLRLPAWDPPKPHAHQTNVATLPKWLGQARNVLGHEESKESSGNGSPMKYREPPQHPPRSPIHNTQVQKTPGKYEDFLGHFADESKLVNETIGTLRENVMINEERSTRYHMEAQRLAKDLEETKQQSRLLRAQLQAAEADLKTSEHKLAEFEEKCAMWEVKFQSSVENAEYFFDG